MSIHRCHPWSSILRQAPRDAAAAREPFRHKDDIERVRGFEKPVLLFKGEGSSAFLSDAIDTLGEEFPEARVVQLPGGHAPHIVSQDSFMGILEKYLADS